MRRDQRAVCGLSVVLVAAIAGCSSQDAGQAPQASAVAVFEGARLIDGNGGAPVENSAFIVENKRVTAVGRKGELTVPPGATRVDLTGKTVMPAIIDAHGHLGFLDMANGTMSKANFTREN